MAIPLRSQPAPSKPSVSRRSETRRNCYTLLLLPRVNESILGSIQRVLLAQGFEIPGFASLFSAQRRPTGAASETPSLSTKRSHATRLYLCDPATHLLHMQWQLRAASCATSVTGDQGDGAYRVCPYLGIAGGRDFHIVPQPPDFAVSLAQEDPVADNRLVTFTNTMALACRSTDVHVSPLEEEGPL